MRRTLSTSAVARLIDVAVGSVANWIDQDKLKAGRTPGGHRRIAVDDLVAFLVQQKLPIPPQLAPAAPKVLVVDDEPAVTEWLAGLIEQEWPDYEVLEAHDGFSAGELVASTKPEVVFLDLWMPGMDGFEVCRRIKSNEGTKDTAVIAITAHYTPEAEERILSCGAQACLTKPLSVAAVGEELARALATAGQPG